jgi:hypothetical protein
MSARGDKQAARKAARHEPSGTTAYLLAGLLAHDGLKFADNEGEGVGPNGGANAVVRRAHVCHPVTHGLVDGVLERTGPRLDRLDLRAKDLGRWG